MRIPLATPLTIVAATILGAMGAAYYLTVEPAPVVRVRWAEGLSDARRAELEREFLLVRPRPEDRRTVDYDLLDTSWDTLVAIVRHPDVDDTRGIQQQPYAIPFDAPYGDSWMWVAHRLPGLRRPAVVPAVIAVSAVVLVAGLARALRRIRGGTTRPSLQSPGAATPAAQTRR
jgi:hypothetical protein